MANRPGFINTAGQRKRDGTGFEPIDLLPRYVDAYAGRFKWTGLPEGCPDDFPEVKLFEVGGLSAKKVRGLGDCVMGAAPETLTIYGTPLTWLPAGIVGNVPGSSVNEYLFKASNNPVLWEGVPMMDRIEPYLRIMCKAMNALQMNTVSLSMPILVETAPGAEWKDRYYEMHKTYDIALRIADDPELLALFERLGEDKEYKNRLFTVMSLMEGDK